MKKLLLCMTALAAALLLPELARAADVREVVSMLQARYETVASFEAEFTQQVLPKGMKTAETSRGKVWFKKPGKMRWEYSLPAGDLIVGDGSSVWIYQPDLNQAIEKKIDEAASSMAIDFLSGVGSLDKEFVISLEGEKGGAHRLSLTPRKQSAGLKRLVLEVDKASRLIRKSVVFDHFGTETTVELRAIKLNAPAGDSLFSFTPPAGAEIVRP